MSDKPQDMNESSDDKDQATPRATRRGFLTGMAALGASAAAGDAMAAQQGTRHGHAALRPANPAFTRALRKHVKNVVVIYAENRSFNNLFGNFPGVEKPLSALNADDYRQLDRDGGPLDALPPVWGGMVT